jgi:hypothetical protein
MKPASGPRPIPLLLTAMVAVLSAVVALAVSNGLAMGHDSASHHGSTAADAMAAHAAPLRSNRSIALRLDLRKLWEDHITWTRLAIISLEAGTPDTDATVGRLLKNQDDIGAAVKPYYGRAAGNALAGLLRSHILIAADVVAAAKAGDATALADAQARWERNADDIARFLHRANPHNWPLATLQHEMHMHLDLTTQEAVAHLQGRYDDDVAAYDRVHDHILHMSDLLATGIVKQFPARFR